MLSPLFCFLGFVSAAPAPAGRGSFNKLAILAIIWVGASGVDGGISKTSSSPIS